MEEQRERTGGRRRQRRKAKGARSKVVIEPVLIAARRPDSPLLKNGFRNVVASAQPKAYAVVAGTHGETNGAANGAPSAAEAVLGANGHGHERSAADDAPPESSVESRGESAGGELSSNGHGAAGAATADGLVGGVRRRVARIIKLADNVQTPGNREQLLLDRLIHSQGRGAISRAADDLWESKIAVPKRQEIQIQLLEHENEHRARDAVFALAELLQREAPIKRPLLDQRLRRLETSADDPITRDAAGALRRSMRVHHGL